MNGTRLDYLKRKYNLDDADESFVYVPPLHRKKLSAPVVPPKAALPALEIIKELPKRFEEIPGFKGFDISPGVASLLGVKPNAFLEEKKKPKAMITVKPKKKTIKPSKKKPAKLKPKL